MLGFMSSELALGNTSWEAMINETTNKSIYRDLQLDVPRRDGITLTLYW